MTKFWWVESFLSTLFFMTFSLLSQLPGIENVREIKFYDLIVNF